MAGNRRSGRRNKPTALHLLGGTFRPDRHVAKNDAFGGTPDRPADLDDVGNAFWDVTVTALIAAGVAKRIDTAALWIMTEMWVLYRRAYAAALADPLDKTARCAVVSYRAAFDSLAARFGLTPSDRVRLDVVPMSDQTDPLEAMIRARGIPKRNRAIG